MKEKVYTVGEMAQRVGVAPSARPLSAAKK